MNDDTVEKIIKGMKDDLGIESSCKDMVVIDPPERSIVEEASEDGPDRKKDIQEDYDYARKAMIAAIEQGTHALKGLTEFVKEGPSPRAFEVLSNMVKTVNQSAKDLMDLHEKMDKIERLPEPKKEDEPEEPDSEVIGQQPGVVNNMLFVGSTSELMEMMKQRMGSSTGEVFDAVRADTRRISS